MLSGALCQRAVKAVFIGGVNQVAKRIADSEEQPRQRFGVVRADEKTMSLDEVLRLKAKIRRDPNVRSRPFGHCDLIGVAERRRGVDTDPLAEFNKPRFNLVTTFRAAHGA
jgi:hypothetical protein